MDHARRMTARALARAMLAGAPRKDALAARMAACLDENPPWLAGLAAAMARIPGEAWRRLDVAGLAARVEAHEGFAQAWTSDHRPEARRWLLRPPEGQGAARPAWSAPTGPPSVPWRAASA